MVWLERLAKSDPFDDLNRALGRTQYLHVIISLQSVKELLFNLEKEPTSTCNISAILSSREMAITSAHQDYKLFCIMLFVYSQPNLKTE